jgi:hypothetical protein
MGMVKERETSVIYVVEGDVLRKEMLCGGMLEEYGVVMVDEVYENLNPSCFVEEDHKNQQKTL